MVSGSRLRSHTRGNRVSRTHVEGSSCAACRSNPYEFPPMQWHNSLPHCFLARSPSSSTPSKRASSHAWWQPMDADGLSSELRLAMTARNSARAAESFAGGTAATGRHQIASSTLRAHSSSVNPPRRRTRLQLSSAARDQSNGSKGVSGALDGGDGGGAGMKLSVYMYPAPAAPPNVYSPPAVPPSVYAATGGRPLLSTDTTAGSSTNRFHADRRRRPAKATRRQPLGVPPASGRGRGRGVSNSSGSAGNGGNLGGRNRDPMRRRTASNACTEREGSI